ncbi:MAG: hypothetical protein JWN89_376 [Parcubacteria group bacterium]|nr:hypothetical protein [Parcubacteria group bacterium]
MKKLLLLILGLVIVGGLVLWKRPANAPGSPIATSTPETSTDLLTYTDPAGQFQFSYPKEFAVSKGPGLAGEWMFGATTTGSLLGTITVPRSYMPNTNFADAKLTVGRSNAPSAIRTCTQDTTGLKATKGTATISGFPFTSFAFTDAAAGNRYETTSYRGILDGDCYAIEYTIHYGNISNYPAGSILEFDKQKLVNDLESIVKSFKLLISSN